jgi:hypothetical protein
MSFANKKSLIYIALGIAIGLIIVSLFLYFKEKRNYYAVFFNNGNVYFGNLSFFPKLKLKNAFYLSTDQQGQLVLRRFKDADWRPRGEIYLNKEAIMFIAPIDSSSDLVRLIKGEIILPTQPQGIPSPSQQNLPQGATPQQPSQPVQTP